MKIKIKRIEHEIKEDAPFVGALICANNCNFKCKDCFNVHMKKEKTKITTEDEIIKEVLSNPFNKGIIFGGLEWSEQCVELLHIARVGCDNNLEIMIYTGCETLNEFHQRVGEQILALPEYRHARPTFGINKKEYYEFIGRLTLDNFIYTDYYIKTGKYDGTKKVENRKPFGVKLSTENQKMYKIEGVKENENETEN